MNRERKLKIEFQAEEQQKEENRETWLDKKLLVLMLMTPIINYGLYFVLYYSCRVFQQPLIAMAYWILCGIYMVILLVYIMVSEWYHEETMCGEISFFQALFGLPISKKLSETCRKVVTYDGGGGQ